jgi:hypothetical protein
MDDKTRARIHREDDEFLRYAKEARRRRLIQEDADWRKQHPTLHSIKQTAKSVAGAAVIGGAAYGGYRLHKYVKKHYKK